MPNPLIPQGTLNRVKGSVTWESFPSLQVTAPFLGKGGIRFALEGESTTMIPTMTGVVTSPEPYMMWSLTISLLKPQALANAYKVQMELDALIGNGTVRPDVVTGIGPFSLYNAAIQSVRELEFDGTSADYVVTLKGYYNTNSAMFG